MDLSPVGFNERSNFLSLPLSYTSSKASDIVVCRTTAELNVTYIAGLKVTTWRTCRLKYIRGSMSARATLQD